MIIAIDGPAGSGKSSAAKLLAERLQLPVVNSGLLFRSIAWVCTQEAIGPEDILGCIEVTRNIEIKLADHEQVRVSYQDISEHLLSSELRSHLVDEMSHQVASIPEVRQRVHELQREIVEKSGGVVEGRTVGIHVFPDADVKFWLTANTNIRFERIADQRGTETAQEMMARDEHDAKREFEPMVPAEDAIHIDSSSLSLEEVVDEMAQIVRSRVEKTH